MFCKKLGEVTNHTNILPPITEDGVPILQPESILNHRWIKRSSKIIEESLIKWHNLPTDDATWEPISTLQEQFLDLNLED